MQSMVEVVCVGNGSNKSFNSVYTDPGFCKMVIVQDDDKFPAPRLCLLRRWPNFDGGFGFSLYEDLISSGALKVQEVVRHSPAEAGGLRKNDVIVEINKENIELKSFFPLVEILKEAFAENEMELLVLAEQDAQWYRLRNITVNNNFPNIEYCETPYYGHILKPLDSMAQQGKLGNSQIEFHSSTGKLFRTTLVIDNERESVYRRVEELPSNAPAQSADQSIPPLRPDGTFRHPGADAGSVRVYYRRDQSCRLAKGDEAMADSGVGTIKERRSTPSNLNNTTTSPFSTMGKSNAEIAVDLLHDKWADLMDEYLDDKFRSGPREDKYERPDRDSSAKKSHVIRLNDPSSTMRSKSRSKSRCQSPNDASFSFLYSGRDDFQTTSATSFKDFNQRQQSPFQNTLNRGSPHTQSHNRFTSPHHTLQSPIKQKYPIQVASAGHKSRPSQVTSPIQHTVENQTITSYQYDSSSYTAASAKYHPTNQYSYQEQSYSSNYTRDPASPTGAEKAYTFNKNYSSDGSSLTKPSLIQHEYSSSSSNQLGFQLDENEIRTKGVYYVKSVEANSPSAMAGLKQGDKITKINGKSTSGMSYDQFCDEIVIAQQQQLKNNMIHLMVMRKSAKSSAIGSYSSISKSGTTVLPIKNYKSSSFVDEGYGPDSATSSTTTTAAISSSSNKNLISYVKVTSPDEDKSAYKLAESVEMTGHTAYESTVRPLNVIYDSVISEPEIARESKITPSVSEGTPIVANVLVQKYERELKERELREQEERDREQREREAKERLDFEHKMREQREQEIREQRQREEREARERLEFEEKMREQREVEERREREAEQKMREQRQRELQEREEFERKLKEQEERERVERIEREKELRVKEEREKEQRDREREMARLEFERKIREKREREERDASEAQAALAALTTIIVTDNQESSSNKKLLQVQDEIVTTTLTTNQVYHIQTEDNQESINQVTLEPNNEMIVTDYHATYVQEDDQLQYDSASQLSDEEEQRRQLAEFERQQEVMNELVGCIKHPKMQSSLETRRVYNRESFFGYGMSFHQEPISPSLPQHKLVYPRIEIEPDSPSVDAGLETNQRVVAVNNKYVNEKFYTLDDVAQEIEESYYDKHYTDITVMSADLWSKLINSPIHISEIVRVSPETVEAVEKPIVETIADDQAETTKVRLIKLERTYGDKQFGFDCKTLKPEMRYVASNVQPNLPAHRAGLRNNDNILEVNGEPIHMLEHEKVIKKIKSKDDQVDLLVVSDVNEYYRIVNSTKKEEVVSAESPKSSHAEVNIDLRVPNYVRYYEVKRDPSYKGLGISLTPSGVISSIEASSPAFKAGLKKDQRFVEIDGVNVKNKTNQDISKLIQGKDSLVIGVVDVDEEVEEAEKEKEYSSASNLPSEVIIGSISSKTGKKIQDQLTGFRVCTLVRRPDFDGYGFSMKANESGPHMISSVESNSPAEQSGLRADDLILKVGDQSVVGERYTKTTTLIKNECEKGLLKLEVVDPLSCPAEVRNTPLVPPSGFSTISSASKLNKKSDSIKNLRDITSEMIDSSSPGRNRATSVDSASDRKRPYSMTDLDRIPANSTVRSITSIGTTATGYSQSNLANVSSKSVGNLSSIPAAELPKFKRCVVQLIPEYSEGFGFTLNSKLKPKYTIFSVDPDSPAYAANLRPTDVIVEINKKNIRRLKFDKVKGMLSESKTNGQVEILAISKEGYLFFKNKKKKFSSRKLVTMDNTELHSTLDGIRSRASSVNNNRVSSDYEGDKRAQSVGPAYSRPSTETPSRPHSATPTPIISPMQTDNALDDLIFCTITRSEPSQSIGMSLTKSDKDQQSNFYPMVTDVERGAPAEQAGIMVGDMVIEINGKSTLNKQNKEIRPWIESSGNNIDFIVKRDKSVELKLRQNAKVITDAVVETAVQKIASPSSSEHLSRKESFSQKASAENSPRLVHKEIHMSSSKLQDYSFESSSSRSNKSPKTRNQSEPALEETIRSENTVQSSSPVSRRSASTYTLPRDAPIPRLCRVRAYEESLGFTVSGSKSAPGVFKVTDVAANSAAANSGLRNNDYIIEVSGVNVETLNYTDLIAFIRKKKQEDDLQLLVADRPTLEWYKKKKVPISSQVVPKMQYIETLLKEELEREMANTDLDQSGLNTSENLRSSDKGIKVPFQSGRSVWIHRKIYLCDKPVNNLSISHNDLSQANNV